METKNIDIERVFKTVINTSGIRDSNFYIDHFGIEHATKYKEAVFSHNANYSVHFITKGFLYLNYNNQTFKLGKNSLFVLIPNNQKMNFTVDKKNPAHYYWFSLTGKEVLTILTKMIPIFPNLHVNIPNETANKIKKSFDTALNTTSVDNNVFLLYECFYHIAYLLSQIHPIKTTHNTNNTQEQYLDLAINFTQENFKNPEFNLKQLANYLYISPNYLSTIFKNNLNINFNAYLNNIKIEYALTLIYQGVSSIKEIAFASGFNDQSYFTKVFKKYNNISPSEEIQQYINSIKKQ